jgi:hypothetical protein
MNSADNVLPQPQHGQQRPRWFLPKLFLPLLVMGVYYILTFLSGYFLLLLESWKQLTFEFTLYSFFFALFVFVYAFVYRHILLQQAVTGKQQEQRLITGLHVLSWLLLILGFLFMSTLVSPTPPVILPVTK